MSHLDSWLVGAKQCWLAVPYVQKFLLAVKYRGRTVVPELVVPMLLMMVAMFDLWITGFLLLEEEFGTAIVVLA